MTQEIFMSDLMARVAYNMPGEAYRDSKGLSHSDSKNLRRSPYHYKQLVAPRDPEVVKKASAQMELGTMAHVAALEPHTFAERYVIGPNVSHNSNAWRQFVEEHEARGIKPITQQQYDQVHAMAVSVHMLPDFNALLGGSDAEVSLWWICGATGVLCKARPDLIKRFPPSPEHEKGFAILGDLKTTEDASPEAFARSVADYSYHTQAQWYCDAVEAALGIPVASFLFAVVEREYPYACATYTLDDNAMNVAQDINMVARELYVQCAKNNEWPGYPRETRDIALPHWYMKRHLESRSSP